MLLIGSRKLKKIKQFIASPIVEEICLIAFLILLPLQTFYSGNLYSDSLQLSRVENYFNLHIPQTFISIKQFSIYLDSVLLPNIFNINGWSGSQFLNVDEVHIYQQRKRLYENSNMCIIQDCQEYQYYFSGNVTHVGYYKNYDQFHYHFRIQEYQETIFQNLLSQGWMDSNTEALIIRILQKDLIYNRYFYINLFIEHERNHIQYLYSIKQFEECSFEDTFNVLIFFALFLDILILSFRALMELSYIFSRFALSQYFVFFFTAYSFLIIHIYRMILGENIVLQQNKYKVFEQFYELSIIENFCQGCLWIFYPFKVVQIHNSFVPKQLFAIYQRAFPGIFLSIFLVSLGYLNYFINPYYSISQFTNDSYMSSFLPFLEIPFQNVKKFQYIYFFQLSNDYLQLEKFQIIQNLFATFFLVVQLLYALGIIMDSIRKATLIEIPYVDKFEQDILSNIDEINNKLNKVLKQVIKDYIKDQVTKKQVEMDNEFEEDFLNETLKKKKEKILIVYEIHGTYLEEIKRYQEKFNSIYLDFNYVNSYQENKRKNQNQQQPKEQIKASSNFIIGSLMQRSTKKVSNTRLQTMLKKFYLESEPLNDPQNSENSVDDFFDEYQKEIEDNGITIRVFNVLDQVIKFLQMLIQLRPEFLSINSEQTIRIFFYVNAEEVSEDDLYHLISFLIVSLRKSHLSFPILLFGQFKVKFKLFIIYCKNWMLEKDRFLILKKYYKNILFTLNKQCALKFSVMECSFSEILLQFHSDFADKNDDYQQDSPLNASFADNQDEKSFLNT